jgi:hypothetical protein
VGKEEGAMGVTSEQMLSWFDDDELGECPACGQRKVIPAPAGDGLVICSACGVLTTGEPTLES